MLLPWSLALATCTFACTMLRPRKSQCLNWWRHSQFDDFRDLQRLGCVPTNIVGPCVFSLHPATFAVPEFLQYETRMVYFVTFGWLHTSFDAICNLVGRCLKGHLWTLDASWTGEVPVWGSHNTAEAIDSQRIRTSWDLRIQLVALMTHWFVAVFHTPSITKQ